MKNTCLKKYKCSDFNIVCVLRYLDFPLLEIENVNGRNVWFFADSKRLQDMLAKYWQGTLIVNVVEFLAIQRFIKSSINSNNGR